jgi:undecaprenyl-diphosphatase
VIFLSAFVAVFLLLWLLFFAAGPGIQRVFQRAAHWTAAFRYRDYLPALVIVAAGIAGTAIAGDAFLDIVERLHEDSPRLHAIDTEAHAWARDTRTPGATFFFTSLTLLGSPVGLGIVIAIVITLLVLRGRRRWAAYLAITAGVGGLLNLLLKSFFERARPELADALRGAHGYSFPSGHAMGSTIVFGALGYLAMRILSRWRYRAAALSLACTLALAISLSRVYLGVHWISDIAAGIAAGLIWLVAATVAYETFRRIRLMRARGGKESQGSR